MMKRTLVLCVCLGVALAATANAADNGLKQGTPDIKSIGPLAFGPDGVLFLGDPKSAAVFAIDTKDTEGDASKTKLNIDQVKEKIAARLGTSADDILVNDLAVNPNSGNAYLSISRGRGPDGTPVLLRIDGSGKISEVSLKDIPFAKASFPNVHEDKVTGEGRRRGNKRLESITDLTFVDGQLIVAGLSNEEFASKLRKLSFPFKDADAGASVEIYHASHGKYETRSPVRTFVPYDIAGEQYLLAAYTCTPLVKFPVMQLAPGSKLRGTTVAELGNQNRPLDMIVYEKDGKDHLLMANSRRGVMKISTKDLNRDEGITERVRDTAGQDYETIEGLEGVVQLDKLSNSHAVVLVENESGNSSLLTIELP